MILLLDVDDTLLDWSHSFDRFIRDNYGYVGEDVTTSDLRLWDLLNTTKEGVLDLMWKHNNTGHFGELEYFRDSEYLGELVGMFSQVICISSCGNTPEIISLRSRNLHNKFPNMIGDLICLKFMEQKNCVIDDILLKYPDETIFMLDDNVDDIRYANRLGIRGCVYSSLFHQPNELDSVATIKEFIKFVKEETL